MKLNSRSRLISPLLFCSCFFFSIASMAQADERSLFTVDGNDVQVDEFEYVYTKNNINNEADYSEKSLRDYLDLYINFRLKVREAEAQGYDTISSIVKELEGYRKQLSSSYLTDKEIVESMMKEAYERMQYEVNASHILVSFSKSASAEDSVKAWNKINEIRKRALKGEDFAELAKEFSDDPSAKENGGNIGFFTAFQTVYPFEDMAYRTAVGEISQPVQTRFGFHLVKVHDKRENRGKITVAHILFKVAKDAPEAESEQALAKAKEVLAKIEGDSLSFARAAQTFSDDRYTKREGGLLPEFGTGKMVAEFEEASFALEKDGDISQPVRTSYGWHLIQRISKPESPSYDEMKVSLKKKVERDSRSTLAKDKLVQKIKTEYGFVEMKKALSKLMSKIDEGFEEGSYQAPRSGTSDIMFRIGERNYSQGDFLSYLASVHKKRSNDSKYEQVSAYYNRFVERSAIEYEESMLPKKYPEFRHLMQEYRDGILLFELTDMMVWSKAVLDTAGLRAFHEANREDYMWEKRVKATVFTCSSEELAEEALAWSRKLDNPQAIKDTIKVEDGKGYVQFTSGLYEAKDMDILGEIEWKKGVSKLVTSNSGNVSFAIIDDIREAEPKQLTEARGYVVSSYQEHLEKEWIEELRAKYEVKVNEEVLKSLIGKN